MSDKIKLEDGKAYKFKRHDGVMGCGHAILHGGGVLFANVSFPDGKASLMTADQLEMQKIEIAGELDLGGKKADPKPAPKQADAK